eukprot:3661731-Pyramimonas_sp.AAC.1
MARSGSDLRSTALYWALQQPSKVATVSTITAPPGWRGLIWSRCDDTVLAPFTSLRIGDGFADSSPPGMA